MTHRNTYFKRPANRSSDPERGSRKELETLSDLIFLKSPKRIKNANQDKNFDGNEIFYFL